MKTFFLIFVFIFSTHSAFSRDLVYVCNVKNFEGKYLTIKLIRNNNKFTMVQGPNKFPLRILVNNQNYLHLFQSYNQVSFHIGVNKKINFLIMDGMDLKNTRPLNRTSGYCSVD